MANTEAAAATAAVTKAPRERKAEHAFIGKDGEISRLVDGKQVEYSIEEALGNRYTDKATGEYVDFICPAGSKAGKVVTMLALFGARTLMINTASAARNAGEDELTAIAERIADSELKDGAWQSPRVGTGGPRYNPEVLAQAIATVKATDPKHNGQSAEEIVAHYLAKITDPANDKYGSTAMKVDEVKDEYNRLRGRVKPTADIL